MFAPGIGDPAPDFTADSSQGPIGFHAWAGPDWVVLFSHPHYFRPVCLTELAQASQLAGDFAAIGCKLLAVCIDPLDRFAAWADDVRRAGGTAIAMPVASDPGRAVLEAYGMIHPGMSPDAAARVAVVVDPARRVRASLSFPSSLGRDFRYILQLVTSLQFTDASCVATPAGWTPGGPFAIVPGLGENEMRTRFPAGWTEATSYLRYVAQPVPAGRRGRAHAATGTTAAEMPKLGLEES